MEVRDEEMEVRDGEVKREDLEFGGRAHAQHRRAHEAAAALATVDVQTVRAVRPQSLVRDAWGVGEWVSLDNGGNNTRRDAQHNRGKGPAQKRTRVGG